MRRRRSTSVGEAAGRAASLAAAVAFPLALAGCGAADRPDGPVIHDSAGVTIVTSAGPRWGPDEGWRMADSPSLLIGSAEGEGPYALFAVVTAKRLPGGEILVAERSGPRPLRIFGADGSHLRSFGGEGEGPGEFRSILRVCTRADTIVAYDAWMGRLTAFTADGELAGVRTVAPIPVTGTREQARSIPVWFDAFGNCDLVGRPNSVTPSEPGPGTIVFSRLEYDDLSVHPLASVQAGRWVAAGDAFGGIRDVRFSAIAWAAAGDSTVFISDAADFTIQEFARDGRLLRRFDRPWSQAPITPEEVRRFEQWELENAFPGRTDAIRQRHAGTTYAEAWPAHESTLRVDAAGHLWVLGFQRPWIDSPTRTWSVFDPTGVFLGEVTTPAAFRVTEIGEDYLLGVWKDELDVESVRMFPLVKP